MDEPRKNRVVITGDGGLRFTADVRGHSVPTDQPAAAGGGDTAAMPLELLAVSLGTCIALYAHQFCATRDIADAGLEVAVEYRTTKAPSRIAAFDVSVVLPDGFPEEYRAAVERAVRSCPVHNTLKHPPEISLELSAPAAAF